MTIPTLVAYSETASWVTSGASKTATVSWQPGDLIVYIAGSANAETLAVPTGTGLTFVSVKSNSAAGTCSTPLAICMPQTSGSAVTMTGTNSISTDHWGFGVWVFRNSLGGGNSIERHTGGSAALESMAMTPTTAECAVVWGCFDFAASALGTIVPTPTNTRQRAQDPTIYTFYVADLTDQTSGGSTLYGISGAGATTGPFSIVALEIMSTADGRTGGRCDDRWRVRPSQFWSGTATLGTKRSVASDDSRDGGRWDQLADYQTSIF